MNSSEAEKHSGKFTITFFGKNLDLIEKIENRILEGPVNFEEISNFELRENDSLRSIRAPKFFEECSHPDQNVIDFMALSYPGPHWFILAIESGNAQDKVADQISKLQEIFGNDVGKNVFVMLEKQQSYNSLKHIGEVFKVEWNLNEHLASKLMEQSSDHHPFQFNYKNYSKDIVKKRKKCLERNRFHPQNNPTTTPHQHQKTERLKGNGARSSSETVFNIVLLGKSGTGKSASANTLMAAGNSMIFSLPNLSIRNSQQDSRQHFASYPSSTPVTTKCEVKRMKVRPQFAIVDTPDFFYEEENVLEDQLKECKKYCQAEQFVVLLVVQLGRFTEGERGILEKLEEHLGREIRDHTIVLFTHGEDLNVEEETFIGERSHLKHIVDACDNRYHVFKNTSKDSKQVFELINKFPSCFPAKPQSSQCSLS